MDRLIDGKMDDGWMDRLPGCCCFGSGCRYVENIQKQLENGKTQLVSITLS